MMLQTAEEGGGGGAGGKITSVTCFHRKKHYVRLEKIGHSFVIKDWTSL